MCDVLERQQPVLPPAVRDWEAASGLVAVRSLMEARRLGVNRQSIIKVWIAERLERGTSSA